MKVNVFGAISALRYARFKQHEHSKARECTQHYLLWQPVSAAVSEQELSSVKYTSLQCFLAIVQMFY